MFLWDRVRVGRGFGKDVVRARGPGGPVSAEQHFMLQKWFEKKRIAKPLSCLATLAGLCRCVVFIVSRTTEAHGTAGVLGWLWAPKMGWHPSYRALTIVAGQGGGDGSID